MTDSLPPNVRPTKDRHGKIRYRFRRKGWKSAYLPGEPGSAEFHKAYAEIVAEGAKQERGVQSPKKVQPKSLDDLFIRMTASPGWKKKKPSTQLAQSRVYHRFLDRVDQRGRRYGERPVATVTIGWLDGVLGSMWETPGAANDLRKKLKVLLEYAIGLRWLQTNPARHTTAYDPGEGFHDWTDAEIEQYRACHPLGTMARLTLELALNTAGRRCNVARLTRDDVQAGRIVTAHVKGNNVTSVPMMATTKEALDALPAAPIKSLITTQFGKPFSVNGLGNRMRKWCDEAGLSHCSIHGLRKAMSRRLAESGATDAEGMAVTGHKKDQTFRKYREMANRTALASVALSRLDAQPVTPSVAQPPAKDCNE